MNKRLCWCAAPLTLLSPFATVADEPAGPTIWDGLSGFLSPDWDRDFSATLGVKFWINDWSRSRAFLSGDIGTGEALVFSADTAPESVESDIEPVPIPQISAKYKWLFVTGSYYAKTGFDFDDSVAIAAVLLDTDGDGFADTGAQSTTVFSTSGDRYEWDASGGVYIHPYVVILGGYKKVRQEVDSFLTQDTMSLVTGATIRTDFATIFSDVDIEGPTIGIATFGTHRPRVRFLRELFPWVHGRRDPGGQPHHRCG